MSDSEDSDAPGLADLTLKPTKETPALDASDWPLLLKNYHKMVVRTGHYTPIVAGCSPLKRKLKKYLDYGVVFLDKPANPSSHEVAAWMKRILKVEKTGHAGTLDPKVSGKLVIYSGRSTRLAKLTHKSTDKQYVAICRFHKKTTTEKVVRVLEKLRGPVLQRPPLAAAVKRTLRVRTIYDMKLLEMDEERSLAVIWVKCAAGTYIRTLCVHLGILLQTGAHMEELRRVKTGAISENDGVSSSMHDVLDAMWLYENHGDEKYIRHVVHPVESLLVDYKRVIIKDSAVAAITHGAKIMIPGILRIDKDIELGDEIVVVSPKGEAVCLAFAQMTTLQMATVDHGVAAKIKRVIMDASEYPKRWGLGPMAQKKKKLIAAGELDKHGRPNDKTSDEWKKKHPDYSKASFVKKNIPDDVHVEISKDKKRGKDGKYEADGEDAESEKADAESGDEKKKKKKKKKKRKREEAEAEAEEPKEEAAEKKKKKKKKKKRKLEESSPESPAKKRKKG